MFNFSAKKIFSYSIFFSLIQFFCVSLFAGYSGNIYNPYGDDPFIAACRSGNLDAVSYFLDDENYNPDKTYRSARTRGQVSGLLIASANGHKLVVDKLIANNASVNLRCDGGATALFLAAQNGKTEVVRTLLAAGADVTLGFGESWQINRKPWMTALMHGNLEIFRMISNPPTATRSQLMLNVSSPDTSIYDVYEGDEFEGNERSPFILKPPTTAAKN